MHQNLIQMSMKDQLKYERQRDQQYIEAIQSQYLTHRFSRIMAILSKNYVYSFSLLLNVHSLYPNKLQQKADKLASILVSILQRHKNNVLRYSLRNLERKQLSRQKSSALLFEILQRSVININALLLGSLRKNTQSPKTLAKDKQLFLMIVFTNLAKAYISSKTQALNAIKHASYQKKTAINKAKIIILEFSLSTILKSSLRKAFHRLNPQLQQAVGKDQSESQQQEIMIECFKSLAFNLRKINEKKKENVDITAIKKEEAAKNMFEVVSLMINEKLRWTFWQLRWTRRTEYTPQTYQILVRQIDVLEKEYQSN